MRGKKARVMRKMARKQLTKDFGKNYADKLVEYTLEEFMKQTLSAPLKDRVQFAWKILRGKV